MLFRSAIPVDRRPVAVPEDADSGLRSVQPFAGLLREAPALEQNMCDRDSDSGAPDDALAREPALLKIIDISRHGNHRGDPLELPDDAGTADISGMKNRRDSGKVLDERRIEEPVCIGDDSDPQNALRAHGAGTG